MEIVLLKRLKIFLSVMMIQASLTNTKCLEQVNAVIEERKQLIEEQQFAELDDCFVIRDDALFAKEMMRTVKLLPSFAYRYIIDYVLYAPSALNQKKYMFELTENKMVKVTTKKGYYVNVDLGIAKYHFELGAGKDNFTWL